MEEHKACPYIVVNSVYVVSGRRSWTCGRHRRIVCQAHCRECRQALTRTPGFA